MPAKVLITGSTGQLGSYLLASLINHPNVSEIWCLNRAVDSKHRQEQQLRVRGLDGPATVPLPAHVHFLQANFAADRLGLSTEDPLYESIITGVTHIIHCAWPVDWNRTFDSFEPSIRGVGHLVDLAASCKQNPVVFFLSSVAAVGNWNAVPGARDSVPEEEVDDWKVARFGYGQSKLVAERLLHEASRVRDLTTAVCRIGQVAGPVDHGEKGQWPMQEWLPSMITSSRYLGMLPRTLGPAEDVEWVPVDRLSTIVLELLFSNHPNGTTQYHHIRNPHMVGWKQLAPTVGNILNKKREDEPVVSVDFLTWIEALEESAASPDLEQNPAVKLLPFFQNLKDKTVRSPRARAATLEVRNSVKRSETLKQLEAMNEQWMALWMKQWAFV